MKAAKAGYSSERATLVMIVASLAVIACTIGLLMVHQKNDREEQIRARGTSLARLLSGLPSDELIGDETYQSMLQLVRFSQGTQDFAYAALINGAGQPLAEVTEPGVIVPPATVSQEPSAWVGERALTLTSDQREILEYYAPVFELGNLAGQIRLGYFKPGYGLLYEQIPVAATLALLIFLLTPLFYFLLKREIRPLATAGEELERLLKDGQLNQQVTISPTAPLGAFMDRFNQFVDYAQGRIRELETDRGELVASAKLISYRKSRIEMVLQALPEAVLILDEHGHVTYANDRVSTLLGASREDVVSKHPREWCGNAEVIEFLSRYESSTASRYMTDTVQFRPTERSTKALALNGYPLFSSNETSDIQGTLAVVRDVTQQNLVKESSSDFVSHLGHELKTPLNTLALYSEVLMEHSEDEGQRVEAVNTIRDEVERLISLVSNLLNINRIETGSFDVEKQRVRLSDLLSDITDNLGRTAKQNAIRINLEIPRDLSPVLVDKDLLRVALNNLVTNAIKYNDPAGTVTIKAEETDDAMLISVRDTGLGIAAEDRERIFDKFYRSEDDDVRERTGHGLGLPLARQIVQMHEGELSVDSELGQGSTFTITLWNRSGLIKKAI